MKTSKKYTITIPANAEKSYGYINLFHEISNSSYYANMA